MADKNPIDPEVIAKKNQHNELERKRRGNIKDNFEMLFEVVPCEEHEKSSRAQILNSTVQYISNMKKTLLDSEKFHAKCVEDIKILEIEMKRVEKCKLNGETPVIPENIIKLIQDAKAATVPEFSKVSASDMSPKSLSRSTSMLTTPSCGSKRSSKSECRLSIKRKKNDTNLRIASIVTTQPSLADSRSRSLSTIMQNSRQKQSQTVGQSLLLAQPTKIKAPQVVNNVSYVRDTSLYGVVARDHNYEGTFHSHVPVCSAATMANIPSMAPIPNSNPANYSSPPAPSATDEDCSSNSLSDGIQSSLGSIASK